IALRSIPEHRKGGTTAMNKLKSCLRARYLRYPAVAAVFLFAGMLIASSLGTTPNARAAAPVIGAASGSPPSFVELAEALGPVVVNIRVTKMQKTGLPDMSELPEGPFGDMFKRFF